MRSWSFFEWWCAAFHLTLRAQPGWLSTRPSERAQRQMHHSSRESAKSGSVRCERKKPTPPGCRRTCTSPRSRRAGRAQASGRCLAAGETVILLQPSLHLVGVSIVMERGCQQNDSLADGYRCPRGRRPHGPTRACASRRPSRLAIWRDRHSAGALSLHPH